MYSTEQLLDVNRKAKFACFGSCLIHIILGSFYSWGNLNIYIVSYFKSIDPLNYSYLTPDISAFVFPCMGLLMFLTNPIGIRIGNTIGFSLSCIFFSILLSVSMFLSSFCEDFWLFVLFYAMIPSLLMGALSSESIYVVYKYRIEKNSVNGLMMLFYGIGTALANFIAFLTINPNNQLAMKNDDNDDDFYFSKEISKGIPDFLRILSVFYMVIGILGSNFMRLPEFDSFLDEPLTIKSQVSEEQFEFVYAQMETEKDDSKKFYKALQETDENSRFYNLKSVVKSWKFFHMFLMIFFCSPFGFFMVNYYKIIGMKIHNNDLDFVIIGSISGLINGLARFIIPLAIKKINFKIVLAGLIIIQIIIIPTFYEIIDNLILFGVWNAIALFCQGGIYALFPKVTYNAFGKNLWIQSYTFMLFAFVLANLLHFGLSSVFLDLTGLWNLLWIYFSLCIISFILAIIFKEEKKL